MSAEKIDFDLIYQNELNLSNYKYIEVVKNIIKSNPDRKNSFIKQKIHDILDETKVKIDGFRNEDSRFTDRYFERLLSEFESVTRSYNLNPVSNFIKNEYQKFREQFLDFPNPIRPEIYLLNDVETVKYLANYHALNKLFNKIIHINWWDEHPVELFLSRVLDKDYYEPGVDYTGFIKQLTGIDIPIFNVEKVNNPEFSLTAHAIAYHLLFEAESKKYPKGIEDFKKYCSQYGFKPRSFKTVVNDAEHKLKTSAMENLHGARELISRNKSETALKEIDKRIKLRNKNKD